MDTTQAIDLNDSIRTIRDTLQELVAALDTMNHHASIRNALHVLSAQRDLGHNIEHLFEEIALARKGLTEFD